MKKIIVWATCFRSRLVSNKRSHQQHRRPGRADETGQQRADRHERQVRQRMGRQIARDANAAGDRIQAEQEHDERDVFADHGMKQRMGGKADASRRMQECQVEQRDEPRLTAT